MTTRHQLTLFVPAAAAADIEDVRRVLDPVQHALIAAHVTLCREDEFDDADALRERLRDSPPDALELVFGPAETFGGHGVLLPCIRGAAGFHSLRAAVLGRPEVRESHAHLTLAHPRNPRAPGNRPETALALPSPLRLRFNAVSLIEQRDSAAWRTLWTLPLGPTA